ncbi:hypothetical protein BS333_16425 [Vibrio azureus]|uniref:Uncharacterized protein n=1 Tax=Vibrio azureus NBRC 104587 TaxID=1219077 RepID=U3A7X6_9VIBR|nr:hypothetical protein [Vibrio azureus]AUI87969.1 hypothetical protein BS333_16425 [Vibrio azureus]GAD76066.1 hypothetical protein VAZ01S_036_00100 [Vibrio azureus NBRC 104587]
MSDDYKMMNNQANPTTTAPMNADFDFNYGQDDSLGNCENYDIVKALDRITVAIRNHEQEIHVVDLVNEGFFLGFFLVIFCGLLALPIVTFIRVLRG